MGVDIYGRTCYSSPMLILTVAVALTIVAAVYMVVDNSPYTDVVSQ